MFIEVAYHDGTAMLININHIICVYDTGTMDVGGCDIRLSNRSLYALKDTYEEVLRKIKFVCGKQESDGK